MSEGYDIVAVGTGFATSFFLHRYLEKSRKKNIRVLVLEAGQRVSHAEQIAQGDPLQIWSRRKQRSDSMFVNRTPEKDWVFFTGFGGGSNCWVACTPRMMPEDFRLYSTYGVGSDWPVDYDELEPFYCDAEELMSISGDSDDSPYPRSRPYPQPPHRFTEPDKVLKQAFPERFFSHPCARGPSPVPGQRGACCGSGVCQLCPIDAKFTILNGMHELYEDPRIEVIYGARVQALEYSNNQVTGVRYLHEEAESVASGDLVVLGANALFNPHIMLRSGLDDPELGRGLCEQVSRSVFIELEGVENFQGGTISTGLGYMSYSGEHRRSRAAALIQTLNVPRLLNIRGRWTQWLQLNFIYEDYRLPENRVGVCSEDPQKPEVTFESHSPQTDRGLAEIEQELGKVLAALPAKSYRIGAPWKTDSHIIGTTVMGQSASESVVDRRCVHHRLRNLVVLGSGVFPTAAPANPTLTLSALALWSAEHLAR